MTAIAGPPVAIIASAGQEIKEVFDSDEEEKEAYE